MLNKIALTAAVSLLLGASAYALDSAGKNQNAAGAYSQGSGQAKNVEMTNVKLQNTSNIKNSAVAGNTGIEVKGENINMKNVQVKNTSNIENSAVAGNTGTSIRSKNVDMKNVKIENNSNIKNSAVAGNTGVSVGN